MAEPVAPAGLPFARAMPEEIAFALARSMPLVVMVSLPGCPFCKVAREHYLAPARRDRQWPVVQVDMRSQELLRDPAGQVLTQDALIRRWRADVAPTVLFLGTAGAELAERLAGASIPDFYGAYLDDRVEQARAAIRRQRPVRS